MTQLVIMSPAGRIDLTHVHGFATIPGQLSGWFSPEPIEAWRDFLTSDDREPAVMYQYETELDGSVSTTQYSGVEFSTGNFAHDPDRIGFSATGRMRV